MLDDVAPGRYLAAVFAPDQAPGLSAPLAVRRWRRHRRRHRGGGPRAWW
ncbi:MAG: hypothetical protein R2939_09970 [Kofleriaceae bacterium]